MIRHALAVAIVLLLNVTPLFGQSMGTAIGELVVKATAADVHKSPTVASPIIGKAQGGTVLEIRRNLGSWVEVPWPNAEAGTAFLHVNSGTIARRSSAVTSNGVEAALAQISAVAAAATAATSATAGARTGQPVAMTQAAPQMHVALPSHQVGMGALMNASEPKFGATARTWWKRRVGVQFSASRPQIESADGQRVPSTQLAPSVLYSLSDSVTNSVWLRPYVGAGPRFYRANLENGLAYEAFGGAEATLAAMPQFALSADMGYRWSRPSFNGFEPRRIGFSFSAHWYVK